MCSSFFILTFLNPYLFNYMNTINILAIFSLAYLSDKGGVRRGREILRENLTLKFIHGINDKVVATSF